MLSNYIDVFNGNIFEPQEFDYISEIKKSNITYYQYQIEGICKNVETEKGLIDKIVNVIVLIDKKIKDLQELLQQNFIEFNVIRFD